MLLLSEPKHPLDRPRRGACQEKSPSSPETPGNGSRTIAQRNAQSPSVLIFPESRFLDSFRRQTIAPAELQVGDRNCCPAVKGELVSLARSYPVACSQCILRGEHES